MGFLLRRIAIEINIENKNIIILEENGEMDYPEKLKVLELSLAILHFSLFGAYCLKVGVLNYLIHDYRLENSSVGSNSHYCL